MNINYDSPAAIAVFLKERQLWLKKRFGQNFLVNPGIRAKLVDLLHLSGSESVWEIGPGIGSLTVDLVPAAGSLTVFEIDRGLSRVVGELYPALRIVEGDVIDTWPEIFADTGLPDRVIGNLPYSSGAAIITSFIQGCLIAERMVFTVQKEQALRMAAGPGSRSYSSFSVLCAYAWHVEQGGDINPGSFFPRPEVMSRIVVLTPNREVQVQRKDVFFLLVRDLFHNKRKTIRNNLETGRLAGGIGKEILLGSFEAASVPLSSRAEELPVKTIACCADLIAGSLGPAERDFFL